MLKRWSVILLALMSCVVIACDDDDDGDSNNNNNNNNGGGTTTYANTMTATMNGQAFSATNILAVSASGAGVRTISLTGTDGNGAQMTIAIAGVSGARSYTFDGQLVTASADDGTISAGNNASGNIDITNITDDGIKATFSYTVSNVDGQTVSVQNGSIDAEFTN